MPILILKVDLNFTFYSNSKLDIQLQWLQLYQFFDVKHETTLDMKLMEYMPFQRIDHSIKAIHTLL